MNLSEIKSRLDNLIKYYDFLAASGDHISAIDKDSFLMKLRELYDVVISDGDANSAKTTVAPVKEEPKVEEPIKEEKTVKKTTQFVFTNTENTAKEEPEPKKEVKTELKAKIEEPIVEAPKEILKVEKKEEALKVEVPKEEPKAVVVETKKEPQKEEPKIEESASSEGAFKEDYAELFVFKLATDIAAKLSEAPIANLSQVLGLNEKFYYINELFGGDAAKFNQSIDYLNAVGDFDKARLYIEENLVEQLGWMKKERKSLAKDFIKLVRRRYLN